MDQIKLSPIHYRRRDTPKDKHAEQGAREVQTVAGAMASGMRLPVGGVTRAEPMGLEGPGQAKS